MNNFKKYKIKFDDSTVTYFMDSSYDGTYFIEYVKKIIGKKYNIVKENWSEIRIEVNEEYAAMLRFHIEIEWE